MIRLRPQKEPVLACIWLALLTIFSSCPRLSQNYGSLVDETIHSAALEGNLLGDSADRRVTVYLPPSYHSSQQRRYPVVYLMHGTNGSCTNWLDGGYQGFNLRDSMDALITEGRIQEMIVVAPDAQNVYGGAFYTNSPVTGRWEDFIAQELVKYIDDKYRTIPVAAARGIAGHSMGGYGAIKLAMKRADIYGALYALSPCCLAWEEDLSSENADWARAIKLKDRDELSRSGFYPRAFIALASSFSPNPNRPHLFVDLPFEQVGGKLRPVEPAHSKWLANFPLAMLRQYQSNLAKLRGLCLDAGTEDQYPHIPITARAFSHGLKRNGIPHAFEEYRGDHRNRIRERLESKALPFFSKTLAFGK